jgi:hypothetical protein
VVAARQLRHLDVHAACVGDAGAQQLFDSLGGNTSLQSLNLRANYITDATLPSLHAAAARNTTLVALSLEGNDFTPSGLASLRRVDRVDVHTRGPSLEGVCCVS